MSAVFDAQLARNQLAAAGETLAALQAQAPEEPWLQARAVVLAAHRDELPAAEAGLRRLWLLEGDGGPLRHAVAAMLAAGWAGPVERLLREGLDVQGVNPHVAALWVARCAAQKDAACEQRLPELQERGEIGVLATVAYLAHFTGVGGAHPARAYLRRHRDALRRDSRTWAAAGDALVALGDYPDAAEWLADWEARPGVEAATLLNLAFALQSTGQPAAAAVVSRKALERDAPEEVRVAHALWVALEEAVAGDATVAAALAPSERESLDPFQRYLAALVETVLVARQLDEQYAGSPLDWIGERLAQADAILPPHRVRGCPALRLATLRGLRRIAEEHPIPRIRLWSRYRQLLLG